MVKTKTLTPSIEIINGRQYIPVYKVAVLLENEDIDSWTSFYKHLKLMDKKVKTKRKKPSFTFQCRETIKPPKVASIVTVDAIDPADFDRSDCPLCIDNHSHHSCPFACEINDNCSEDYCTCCAYHTNCCRDSI